MSGRRVLTAILAGCIVITALTLGGLAPVEPVAAQDDEVPSIPGVYYGELTVTDGSLDSGVVIEAVADGEVQDTIRTDADGTFGGPTISDDALEVQEPDSGEVEFQIAGTAVTVATLEGNTIDDTALPWDSGTQEVILEADADTVAPAADVTITNAPASIEAGTNASIDVDVENTGGVAVTQDIELVDANDTVVDSAPIQLGVGNTTSVTLTYAAPGTTSGNATLTVRSEQDTANVTIAVEASDTPPIAPPPSGGGSGSDGSDGSSGGGGGGGASPPADETNGTDTPTTQSESQTIVTSEEFGLSQVRFTTASNIVAITWEGTDFNGSVTATTFTQSPENVSAVPGAMATISQVTASDEITTEPAIVEQRVTRERLETINAEVADLQVYRYTDGEWAPVETTVADESGDEIILESEVPSLSYLAVSATGEPTAAIDSPAEVTAGENVTLDAGGSTPTYGEITAYEWTVAGESFSGETVTTTVETAGEVTAELVVTNDAGETNTTTATINVTEASETTGTDGGDSGETDGSIPGFTGGLAVLAILLSLTIARRIR